MEVKNKKRGGIIAFFICGIAIAIAMLILAIWINSTRRENERLNSYQNAPTVESVTEWAKENLEYSSYFGVLVYEENIFKENTNYKMFYIITNNNQYKKVYLTYEFTTKWELKTINYDTQKY